MKNIFVKVILLFVVAASFNACYDELDQQPNNSFSPDTYYQNITDFENAMRGVYSGFYGGGYYGGSFLTRPDIMSDNVILAQLGRRSNQFFNEWRYEPNSAWDMMYSPYVVTNRANLIINQIDNISDGSEKDNFLGEARAARALALFDMLRVYCEAPTQTDPSTSLGMPIITSSDDPAIQVPRPTLAESYNYVIQELEAAKSLVNVDNGVGRLNKNAVNALLSRVYLYNGDYSEAIAAANAVTTPIASIANFPGVWTDSNEDGVVFKLDQDRVLDGIGIGIDWSQSVGGTVRPEYVIAFDFFNMYQTNDVRKNAYTFIGADSGGNIYNAIKKMLGEAGQNNGVVDAKVIRAAEVYLNKAEAYMMLPSPNEAAALEALDMVRLNRYSGFTGGTETGAALLDAIKLERRLELFAEGHRFFDVKRWGEAIERNTEFGEFFDGTGTPVPAEFATLPATSHRFNLPIPQREINIYPSFQQNPGYDGN